MKQRRAPASGYFDDAVEGVAILLWATDPGDPVRLATPFFQAAAAAALELSVEVYFTARSVHLLVPGVAERLHAAPGVARSILDTMRDAHRHGVRFYACSDALQAQGLADVSLIAECAGHGGAVQFMSRAGDMRWRSLVF